MRFLMGKIGVGKRGLVRDPSGRKFRAVASIYYTLGLEKR